MHVPSQPFGVIAAFAAPNPLPRHQGPLGLPDRMMSVIAIFRQLHGSNWLVPQVHSYFFPLKTLLCFSDPSLANVFHSPTFSPCSYPPSSHSCPVS